MTVRHHGLSRLEAALDHRLGRAGSRDRDGTKIDRLLRIDDEHVGACCPA